MVKFLIIVWLIVMWLPILCEWYATSVIYAGIYFGEPGLLIYLTITVLLGFDGYKSLIEYLGSTESKQE